MRLPLLALLLTAFASPCLASVRITTTSLPNGTEQSSYSATINATGGCTPYKWSITSGKLPSGVTDEASKNTTSLDLSGTPTTTATYSFTVSVTGCAGHVATASFEVVIENGTTNTVDLSWDASTSSDIVGYNVYRGPNGVSWTKINSSLDASTTYTDSTVANDTTYYYATTAVNTDGNESVKSAAVEAVIP
jgi:hypothetical protein